MDRTDTEPLGLLDHERAPMSSMEAQLFALYDEKAELQAALGTSVAEEVIDLVRKARGGEDLRPGNESLVLQLESLYADQAELRAAVGVNTPDDIIALVSRLRGSIRELVAVEKRRLQDQSILLTVHERDL